MSAFGFDPEQIFARRRSRPRIVRPPGQLRRRIVAISIVVAIIVILIVARWLLGLRADYLYYQSVGHTNVFWTPLIAHIVLFLIGFAIVAILVLGPKRLPEAGRGLGRSMREFKSGIAGISGDPEKSDKPDSKSD